MLLDIHTHIDQYQSSYKKIALEEIRQYRILSVSNSMGLTAYEENKRIASECPLVIPAFGIHPWNAPAYVNKFDKLEQLIDESIFLGEVGLDHHFIKDKTLYDAQLKVFDFFLEQAAKKDKMVILHAKGAEEEVLERLKRHKIKRVIIHWYSGPIDTYRKMVKQGYSFSLGFMVMHSDFIRVIARRIPREQMLLETDNPGGYESRHKKPGMPHIIRDTVREIARLKNQSHQEIEQQAWENFMNMLTPGERCTILKRLKEAN